MPDKVLVYSRFPKAQLIRFGERYELLNAAGKRLDEAFPVAELADVSAMITAGGTPLRGDAMDMLPKLGAMTQRMPWPVSAQTACSRDDPVPKSGPATRTEPRRHGSLLRMKSGSARHPAKSPSSKPVRVTRFR